MSVELDPVELGFRRPFTREVSQMLRLHNSNTDPVAFKVKTTAPKQYCVRPNSGRIEPGGEVEVQVLLQAMKEDLPLDVKCKDKFLVQSVAVTVDRESLNPSTLWSQIEKADKSSIQEKKIRVFFLPPSGGAVSTPQSSRAATNGTPAGRDESPTQEVYTAERGASSVAQGAVSRMESRPEGAKSLGDIKRENIDSKPSTLSNLAAAAPGTEDIKAQLAEAKATIQRLTESQGLRQRNVGGGSSGASDIGSTIVQEAQSAGVSVKMVASLCFISFLLAYLFF